MQSFPYKYLTAAQASLDNHSCCKFRKLTYLGCYVHVMYIIYNIYIIILHLFLFTNHVKYCLTDLVSSIILQSIIYILFYYIAILTTFFSLNINMFLYLLLIFVSLLLIYYAYVLFACQVKNNFTVQNDPANK